MPSEEKIVTELILPAKSQWRRQESPPGWGPEYQRFAFEGRAINLPVKVGIIATHPKQIKRLPLLKPRCIDCTIELTQREIKYYENRCEPCETLWHVRIQAWQQGKPDKELDDLYSATQKPIVH